MTPQTGRSAGPGVPRGDLPHRAGATGWFDTRHRHLGDWAFVVNRLSGLGLVAYLYLHLVILSQLARGPEAWGGFLAIATSPPVLLFDVLLLAGLLAHAFNGIRVTLLGLGLVTSRQKALWVALMGMAVLIALAGASRILGVTS